MSKPSELFVSWKEGDERGRLLAMRESARAMARADGLVLRSSATSIYQNIAPGNVSVREGSDRRDYDWFRPGERLPELDRDVMLACMQAYEKIGLVRNTIDTMADFAVKGIDLVHPRPGIEKWYKQWWRKVSGPERTERILNMLFRVGNVVVKRGVARLSEEDERRLRRGQASILDTPPPPPLPVTPREIPWEYTILNPLSVLALGGELAPFLGKRAFRYAVRVPASLEDKLKNPESVYERQLVGQVPQNMFYPLSTGGKIVLLDPARTEVLFYKRDDWQLWARPMLYSVLTDLQMLAKMKMADLSALDGAISHIRLWKLGDLKERILPTEVAINRLATMLLNNIQGGSIDLIWGPELSLQETSVDIQSFLGESKYVPVLNAIYAGLGIPAALTGVKSESGFTNNFVSLKTLMERLTYGRNVAASFWENEVRLVQQAMGFREPAQLVFDAPTLNDDAAEKRLLVELADRGLVSVEAVLDCFGFIPGIERVRMKREDRMRRRGTLPRRAGPFPDHEESLEKIYAQSGAYAPSQLGIDLSQKKPAEKSPVEVQAKNQGDVEKGGKGQPGKGRPSGKKDGKKRKKKRVVPRQSVKSALSFDELSEWAVQARAAVASLLGPAIRSALGKHSQEGLSDQEQALASELELAVLCRLTPGEEVTLPALTQAASLPAEIPMPVHAIVQSALAQANIPHLEDRNRLEAMAVALFQSV